MINSCEVKVPVQQKLAANPVGESSTPWRLSSSHIQPQSRMTALVEAWKQKSLRAKRELSLIRRAGEQVGRSSESEL